MKSGQQVKSRLKLFSYVVEHDFGYSPNPYFGFCTLCRCKCRKKGGRRNVVELAAEAKRRGEVVWIVGTGGANRSKSAGHGKVVYAMRVDDVLSRRAYYAAPRFRKKKPVPNGKYRERRGDNIKPHNAFEADKQFALVSRHFYYFGCRARDLPARFGRVEKSGPGFKCFEDTFVDDFARWIERRKRGCAGDPCGKDWLERKEAKRCKSSCSESE